MEDLEEVITYHRQALSLHPLGHPKYYISLSNLANAVFSRYIQSGRMEDLEEVILRPPGHPDRFKSLNNLAAMVINNRVGWSISLSLRLLSHPDRSTSLNNPSNAVFARYVQSSRMEDLEE